jgi:glutamate-1-semialdehyde aminotransferase
VTFSGASLGGMFGFSSRHAATQLRRVMQGDREAFNRFFHGMLDAGVYPRLPRTRRASSRARTPAGWKRPLPRHAPHSSESGGQWS